MQKSTLYTMRDVARLARVSVMTVSAVVNGKGGVSPELTQRVEEAIAALDYHPNEVARSLKVKRTSTIGLVVPDVSNFFSTMCSRGLKPRLAKEVSWLCCATHMMTQFRSAICSSCSLAGAWTAYCWPRRN